MKLSTFVQNPAQVIQIYLSSYFIEKGLHYSKYNCDIIPKLLYFYVKFLLVNKILSEKTDNLDRALSIIEMAQTELALFSVIGQSCPDHFNQTCKELFSDSGMLAENDSMESPHETMNIVTEESSVSKLPKSENVTSKKKKKRKSKAKNLTLAPGGGSASHAVVESNVATSGQLSGSPRASSSWGTGSAESQPASWTVAESGGWGSSSQSMGWGAVIDNPVVNDGWGDFKISSPPPPPSSFIPTHITNSLPKTHVRGVVEHSLRRIKAISPPNESSVKLEEDTIVDAVALEEELKRSYWTVVLEPWLMKEETPRILSSSKGNVVLQATGSVNDLYVGNVMPYNCLSDDITVFVEAETRKSLKVGMGLGGTWAQLLRVSDCIKEGKEVSVGETRHWYIMDVLRILPSYYMIV
ncbi:hypothetical protein BDP27DRAFT_1317492 [Rhodocollybia butyracea]|uniref:Uncharacterized protein n=1 Tax=Rhodocollybia butyracea TaxID=206335 RepID=A0A9P5Q2C6_9AGAR|nr:hypothetical protein BDP27DRAFT_1317492 [Rhodocollybia butyracea]